MDGLSIEALAECGNLLQKLLNKKEKLAIIRVWGYESIVRSRLWLISDSRCPDPGEETELVKLLEDLRAFVIKNTTWYDNKCVVEIVVGSWRVFVGYWDRSICIGESLIPNLYSPHYKENSYGSLTSIMFR